MAVGERPRGFLKRTTFVDLVGIKPGKRFDFVLSFQHCCAKTSDCTTVVLSWFDVIATSSALILIKNRPFRDPVSRCAWLN